MKKTCKYDIVLITNYLKSQRNPTDKKANPQADTSSLENDIDIMVYELYGLSEDEVKVVEG